MSTAQSFSASSPWPILVGAVAVAKVEPSAPTTQSKVLAR
jgi:hypothetical protein